MKPRSDEFFKRNIKIHPTAVINWEVVDLVGDNIKIGAYCIIGEYPEDIKHIKKNGINNGVVINSGAVLTGLVTVDGGTILPTYIGSNTFLMKHSHIGHDAFIDNNTVIACGAKIGGHTVIGANCNIGLNAVVHQRHVIREGCRIGMGSVVPLKIKTEPFSKYVGNPIKRIGDNRINYLNLNELP